MDWKEKIPWGFVHAEAERSNLDPNLLAAIIKVESNADTFAIRYEPNFPYRTEPSRWAKINRISLETEMMLQGCSIGLMQVMGCKARELGHIRSLLMLTDEEIGIEYGAKTLKILFKKYGDIHDVIAAYNAGSPLLDSQYGYKNQKYVNKVLQRLKELA